MKIESAGFGGGAPVVSFRANDAPHRSLLAAAMGVATAMQLVRRAAEAAGWRAAIRLAVRAWYCAQPGTASRARPKPRRDRADGCGPHHRQDNTTRAFHGAASVGGVICEHHSGMRAAIGQVEGVCFTASYGALGQRQPPPEKCAEKAWANEPKPPRATPLEPESDDVPDAAWLDDDESLLKKLLRDQPVPDPPWPPDDVAPRAAQSVPDCGIAGAATPGDDGWQFWRGISAKAPPPTASVPISNSATWLERFTGAGVISGVPTSRRLPNSWEGLSVMVSRSCRRR
jgi:hypothetical protein